MIEFIVTTVIAAFCAASVDVSAAPRTFREDLTKLRGGEALAAFEYMLVNDAQFTHRLRNTLLNNHVETLGEAALVTKLDILRAPNAGRSTVKEIEAFFAHYGIPWGSPVYFEISLDERLALHRAGARTIADVFKDDPQLQALRATKYYLNAIAPQWLKQLNDANLSGADVEATRALTHVGALLAQLNQLIEKHGVGVLNNTDETREALDVIKSNLDVIEKCDAILSKDVEG